MSVSSILGRLTIAIPDSDKADILRAAFPGVDFYLHIGGWTLVRDDAEGVELSPQGGVLLEHVGGRRFAGVSDILAVALDVLAEQLAVAVMEAEADGGAP